MTISALNAGMSLYYVLKGSHGSDDGRSFILQESFIERMLCLSRVVYSIELL